MSLHEPLKVKVARLVPLSLHHQVDVLVQHYVQQVERPWNDRPHSTHRQHWEFWKDNLPWKNERGPSSNQTNTGTLSKATLGETSEIRGGAHVGFSERIVTLLHWTVLRDWRTKAATVEQSEILHEQRAEQSPLHQEVRRTVAKR